MHTVTLRVRVAVAVIAAVAAAVPAAAQATIYSGPNGPRDVRGSIEAEWLRLGGPRSAVGNPLTSEIATPRRAGAYNHFEGGSIYWTATTGARDVRGPIRGAWAGQGWENGPLGFPTVGQTGTPNGRGAYNHFEGGSIYWTATTGARDVRGPIRGAWAGQGWENGPLGFPTSDTTPTGDSRGAYAAFEGGRIYWTPTTGAHALRGDILDLWLATGGVTSPLGYPTHDEEVRGEVRLVSFEHGAIEWHPRYGAAPHYSVTGSGDRYIPFVTGSAPMVLHARNTDTAAGPFQVSLVDGGGVAVQSLVSATGTHEGNYPVNFGPIEDTTAGIQIRSAGSWQVILSPLSNTTSFYNGTTAVGGGDDVIHYTGPARDAGLGGGGAGGAGSYFRVDQYDRDLTLVDSYPRPDTTGPGWRLGEDVWLVVKSSGSWSIAAAH